MSNNHHHTPISHFYYIHDSIQSSKSPYRINLPNTFHTHHFITEISFHSSTRGNPNCQHSIIHLHITYNIIAKIFYIIILPTIFLNQSTFISITLPFSFFHSPDLHYTFLCQLHFIHRTFSNSFKLMTHYSPIFHTHNPYSPSFYTHKQIAWNFQIFRVHTLQQHALEPTPNLRRHLHRATPLQSSSQPLHNASFDAWRPLNQTPTSPSAQMQVFTPSISSSPQTLPSFDTSSREHKWSDGFYVLLLSFVFVSFLVSLHFLLKGRLVFSSWTSSARSLHLPDKNNTST